MKFLGFLSLLTFLLVLDARVVRAGPDGFSDIRALAAANVAAVNTVRAARVAQLADMAEHVHLVEYFRAPAEERKKRLLAIKASLKGADMGSELCLIDNEGAEHLRVVRGRFASDRELSKVEAEAPFFPPGMALRAGQFYTSDPYLSPDVEEWVIGVVVPVLPGELILHYEHPVKQYHETLRVPDPGRGRFVIVVDRAGHIIADSRGSLTGNPAEPLVHAKNYFLNIRTGEGALPATIASSVLSGTAGQAEVTWRGKPYALAWQAASGLFVAAFEER
ncbi:MAG: cache domain-containing protein [Alphaproteobacteria bacterium]